MRDWPIRWYNGVPPPEAFGTVDGKGTPIVIDTTSHCPYYLGPDNQVYEFCQGEGGGPIVVTGNKLLHCRFDGVPGSTSFKDISPFLRTLTGNADLKLSDDWSQFGLTSLKWTSRNPAPITLTGSEWDWYAGEVWSIGFWLFHHVSENFTAAPLLVRWETSSSNYDQLAQYSTPPQLEYDNEVFGPQMTAAPYAGDTGVYVELCSDGSTLYFSIDGVLVYTVARARSTIAGATFYIGGLGAASPTDATVMYMSELIVVEGQCFHTTFPFTPPTQRFA